MQFTIDINNDVLEKMVNDKISKFTEDEIEGIAKQVIINYVTKPEIMERIIFCTEKDWNGCYNSNRTKLSSFCENLISRSFSDEELRNYREKLYEEIKAINKEELVSDVMYKVFCKNMFTMENRGNLEMAMTEIFNMKNRC